MFCTYFRKAIQKVLVYTTSIQELRKLLHIVLTILSVQVALLILLFRLSLIDLVEAQTLGCGGSIAAIRPRVIAPDSTSPKSLGIARSTASLFGITLYTNYVKGINQKVRFNVIV